MNIKLRKTLIKVDKFGTKIYDSQRHCVRCGGRGGFTYYPGYTCFRCGGTGIDPVNETIKEYTPERRAQLDAINEKRRQKKHQAYLESIPSLNEEYRKQKDIDGEFIYVVKGNTFKIKDELKKEGFHYYSPIGIYRKEPTELDSYKIKVEDLIQINEDGLIKFKEEKELVELIDNLKAEDSKSEWVGEEGDRIGLKVKLNFIREYSSRYGDGLIYNMTDENENIIIYFGTVNLDFESKEYIMMRATVKKHDEYKGIKQTVINRPKVVKGE